MHVRYKYLEKNIVVEEFLHPPGPVRSTGVFVFIKSQLPIMLNFMLQGTQGILFLSTSIIQNQPLKPVFLFFDRSPRKKRLHVIA